MSPHSPRTTVEEFRQYGAKIASTYLVDLVSDNTHNLRRRWLDDAPYRAQPHEMALWGKLVLIVLKEQSTGSDEKDVQRLGNYLHAMAALSEKQWRLISSVCLDDDIVRSPYQVFQRIARTLQIKNRNQGSELLKELLLANSWNPDVLLNVLCALRKNGPPEVSISFEDTSESLLMHALWQQMHQTTWRPLDTPIYGGMWQQRNFDGDQKNAVCAALMSQAAPSETGAMLLALLNATNAAPEVIAPLFPLPISTCNTYSVLDPLIGLLTDGGRDDLTYKAKIVEQQLRLHHPALLELLEMHLTLFPEASEFNSMATFLVPGFDALYGRPVEPAVVISGNFFDEPDNGAIS